MTEQEIIDIGIKTVWVSIKVAAPSLLATLVIGLVVSIVQAATQINEQTLSFIPKILGMTLATVLFGPWILQLMVNFTLDIMKSIPSLTH